MSCQATYLSYLTIFKAILLKTNIQSITVGSFRHSWFISSQVIIQGLKLPDVRYLGHLWSDFQNFKACDLVWVTDEETK